MPKLSGLRIVVTRAAHQADDLARPLHELGALVFVVPLIGIAPPADMAPLCAAAANLQNYDWVVFTSANTVAALAEWNPQRSSKFAAIGSATREAAESHGFPITLVPREHVAESLIESFGGTGLSGMRILLPGAAATRDVLPDALRKMGAIVDIVEAYRNVIPPQAGARLDSILREPLPDWITFASPSAVDNAVSLVGCDRLALLKIATIGPVTSAAVHKHRLEVAAEAAPHTIEGMVDAIVRK